MQHVPVQRVGKLKYGGLIKRVKATKSRKLFPVPRFGIRRDIMKVEELLGATMGHVESVSCRVKKE